MDTGFVVHRIFAVIAFVFLVFQLYGSYYLLSSSNLTRKRKFFYLVFVWVVPLVGCLCVLNWLQPEEIEIPVLKMEERPIEAISIPTSSDARAINERDNVL